MQVLLSIALHEEPFHVPMHLLLPINAGDASPAECGPASHALELLLFLNTHLTAAMLEIRKAQCHCGAVRFEVILKDDLKDPIRCNCSYCRMKGAIIVTGDIDGIKILHGKDKLTTYKFHSNSVEHYFCSHCGIYTHHQRRSDPGRYGVNAACLEGVSPFDFENVPVVEGINHPMDTHKDERRMAQIYTSK